ncbi:MAG: RluA family pseudouridine synthase [Patescibacteria group bacterium]
MQKEIEKIYEDGIILVINKPSGLVVNRSNTNSGRTLQDILEEDYFLKSLESGVNLDEEYVNRSGIVHRLDKDTSGVLVAAKTPEAFQFLQKEFKERNILKEYIAVVHNRVEDEIIEIDAPLGRNPNTPLKIAVVSDGKPAFTKVEKIKEVEIELEANKITYTLVKVLPKTGRTHQIRIHLAAIGHPIAGDTIYCSNNLLKVDENLFKRLMLHARFLSFTHPKTHEFQRFEAPLPKEFLL